MPFARLVVTRTESTELYIEVPEGFDAKSLIRMEYQQEVGRIAEETTEGYDWDKSEWIDTVDVQSVSLVSEEEAKKYQCGKLSEEVVEFFKG
jgi:hypothetical protein